MVECCFPISIAQSFIYECALSRFEVGYHSNHMVFFVLCACSCFVPPYLITCFLDWITARSYCLCTFVCRASVRVCHSITVARHLNHTLTAYLQQPPIPAATCSIRISRKQPRRIPERRPCKSLDPQWPWLTSLQQRYVSRNWALQPERHERKRGAWHERLVRQWTLLASVTIKVCLLFAIQCRY
jgi:hypothetical protein